VFNTLIAAALYSFGVKRSMVGAAAEMMVKLGDASPQNILIIKARRLCV
jgi:hypothetical protein